MRLTVVVVVVVGAASLAVQAARAEVLVMGSRHGIAEISLWSDKEYAPACWNKRPVWCARYFSRESGSHRFRTVCSDRTNWEATFFDPVAGKDSVLSAAPAIDIDGGCTIAPTAGASGERVVVLQRAAAR